MNNKFSKFLFSIVLALSLILPGQAIADSLVYGQYSILNADDGSATVPTYSFINDTNSGFYRSGADEVSLSLGGTQKYVFGASSLSIPGLTITGLTASKPVFTDASKNLVSTGTLGVDQGGTGATSLTDHGILLGSGTSAVTPMSVGTNGQLVKGVTGADPAWSTTALTDGTNTFNLTNGTAALDIAAGATLNIDKSLTVDGQATTITGAGQANTLTLNESLTVGDGYSGTVTFSGASKAVTVADNTTLNGGTHSGTNTGDVTVSAPISLSGQALSLVNNAGSPETITTIDTDGTLAANSDVYLATQKATKTYADLKLAKASNLSDVADAATAFGNIKQSATTAATGVVALGTTTEAIAGADTSKVITPETLKYVLDTMLAQTNDIGDPGQMGFGVGICPPELLPTGFTGMPGYNIKGHSNYGNYLYSDGSVMVWIPWHVYRIAHASNPTYTDYGVNSVDIKSAIDYPWKRIRVSAITAANPAVVTTETPHGRTAGDYIWLSHITSDANWAPYSGQLYKVGTVGSTTTFNLQTAAGVDVDSSGYGGAFSNAAADLKACMVYTGAEAAGYAVHRAFIDGGILQQGYMYDKYKNSKVVKGTGYSAGSIKNGLPISTAADHNKISDLTAVTNNYYYETITAAHARDGTDGAVNASSIFHEKSIFQSADIALLSLVHGQAAKTLATTTTYCAWYHATYNFPKGLNNNQAPSGGVISNADANDSSLTFESDGYSNCGKTGSGSPFAKTTHNGQNCGVADVNGLMHETAIGLTAVSSSLNIIAASKADPCVIQTSAAHGLSDNDYVRIASVGGMTQLNDKIYKVTIVDADEFSLQGVNSSSYSDYTAGGTAAKATWYIAKPSTAMKTFTSDNTEVTGHWGATGVAAMMDAFTPVFETSGGGAFAQRMGSGSNQVLSESLYGANWLLTGIGSPKDADGIDTTGTDLFGKDYYYQYVINELCVLAAGGWSSAAGAGAWNVNWYNARSGSSGSVGARAACYPE